LDIKFRSTPFQQEEIPTEQASCSNSTFRNRSPVLSLDKDNLKLQKTTISNFKNSNHHINSLQPIVKSIIDAHYPKDSLKTIIRNP
jgi:hypothetical protein